MFPDFIQFNLGVFFPTRVKTLKFPIVVPNLNDLYSLDTVYSTNYLTYI